MNETSALLSALEAENIQKIFEFFKEPKTDLNLGFNSHLGRFQRSSPAHLYLRAIGENRASVLLKVKEVFIGAELPEGSTRLKGFEKTPDKWFVKVGEPKRLNPPIEIKEFKDHKTGQAIRNDFQGVRQVSDLTRTDITPGSPR